MKDNLLSLERPLKSIPWDFWAVRSDCRSRTLGSESSGHTWMPGLHLNNNNRVNIELYVKNNLVNIPRLEKMLLERLVSSIFGRVPSEKSKICSRVREECLNLQKELLGKQENANLFSPNFSTCNGTPKIFKWKIAAKQNFFFIFFEESFFWIRIKPFFSFKSKSDNLYLIFINNVSRIL